MPTPPDWNFGSVTDGSFPGCFIQWKGTDVCVDLHCTCGTHHHFDGMFLYAWKCGNCGKCWEMGTAVRMRPCQDDHPSLRELKPDDANA